MDLNYLQRKLSIGEPQVSGGHRLFCVENG